MREVVFTIGAALRSEKKKTAKRINQCTSFIKLAILGENVQHLTTHGNIVTFECDSFGIVEEHSSKDWKKFFPYEKEKNKVIITLPECYVIGTPIPGYQ